jgi:hypothetical protein
MVDRSGIAIAPFAKGKRHGRAARDNKVLTVIATLDAILARHAGEIGADFEGYRNHAYRVANHCLAQRPADDIVTEKVAIAAAFHDLGIWTDQTFDYLEPSVALATAYLAEAGRDAWIPEIAAMIREHHKITHYRGDPGWLVEDFRRADWIDVTLGVLTFGMPRGFLREVQAAWPDAGFHRLLVRLELRHLGKHPLNPIPVLRW